MDKITKIQITHLDGTIEEHTSLSKDVVFSMGTFGFVSIEAKKDILLYPAQVKRIEKWEI